MNALILTIIFLFLVCISTLFLYHLWLRHYITKLVENVKQSILSKKPLSLTHIPHLFRPLIPAVQSLLDATPCERGIDKLTGLMNRVGFKTLVGTISPISTGSFLLIDIYRFRYVNELFGFELTDQLIKKMADRFNNLAYNPEIVARLKGDEFVLYWPQSLSKSDILQIKEQLQAPYNIHNTPISVRLQCGCLNENDFVADVGHLLRRLDLALKNCNEDNDLVGFYQIDDDLEKHRELLLSYSLPSALVKEEFCLVYQPKMSVKNKSFSKVEALMRWQHQSYGLLLPDEFIPLAECSGMINQVSFWVLHQVLLQQKTWRQSGINVQVAINLSTKDLCCENLCEEIQSKLKHYDLPADVLLIEITESTLMADIDKSIETLVQLKQLGIKLAIDDFGTGYSSLAYLKYLPVDEIKIDRMFTDSLLSQQHNQDIISSCIDLAHKLDFTVTVEGIETREVSELVIEMGADTLQGNLFGAPMSARELENFLEIK